jgi:hypothetical protein
MRAGHAGLVGRSNQPDRIRWSRRPQDHRRSGALGPDPGRLLPAAAALVKAFGTLSAPTSSAAARREPERAVLFYAADDAGDLVADLIRVSGYEPVRVSGLDHSIRIEMLGDPHEVGAWAGS